MNRPEPYLPRVRPVAMEMDNDDDGSSSDCGLIVAWPEEPAAIAAAAPARGECRVRARAQEDRSQPLLSSAMELRFRAQEEEEDVRISGVSFGDAYRSAVEGQAQQHRRRAAQARGVRFRDETDARLVELVDEMTTEEIDDMWYTEEDYVTIKKQARATIKYTMLVKKKGDDATDEQRGLARRLCMRGLEHMASADVNQERRLLKDSVVDAVLTEQDRQEAVGALGTFSADEAIAAASVAASKLARDLAVSMGALDSATVLSYGGWPNPSLQHPTTTSAAPPALAPMPSSSASALASARPNQGGVGGINFLSNVFSNATPRGGPAAYSPQHEERATPRRWPSESSLDAGKVARRSSLGCAGTDMTERNKKHVTGGDRCEPVQRSKSADILSRLQSLRGAGRSPPCPRTGEANKEWPGDVMGKKTSQSAGRMFQRKALNNDSATPRQIVGPPEFSR